MCLQGRSGWGKMTYFFSILNVNTYIINEIVSLEIQCLTSTGKAQFSLTLQSYQRAQAILHDTSVVFIGELFVVQ